MANTSGSRSTDETRPSRWAVLTAAPHRLLFFTGMSELMLASAWWGLHLLARQVGAPVWALMPQTAPIWAHAFLMLFTVLPTFFFGFLYTVFPRWMNGPQVPRGSYVATGLLFGSATAVWLVGLQSSSTLLVVAGLLTLAGLLVAITALTRVLLDAEQGVAHAYAVLVGLIVQLAALAGFAFGIGRGSDFALHFAVRTSLWGGLLPVFFTVCHRMIPFFSQGVARHYVAWRPTWVLVGVLALTYARLLVATAGELRALVPLDVGLWALTTACAVRWTSLQTKGNPLAWSLYVGFAWLPIAALLQTGRDLGFALSGEWLLGRAPIHALGMGFFGSMLIAMVTRVTMGHSGRPLQLDRIALGCFLVLQAATLARIASEVVTTPSWMQTLLLASIALWLAAFGTWTARLGRIFLAPRIDGRPG